MGWRQAPRFSCRQPRSSAEETDMWLTISLLCQGENMYPTVFPMRTYSNLESRSIFENRNSIRAIWWGVNLNLRFNPDGQLIVPHRRVVRHSGECEKGEGGDGAIDGVSKVCLRWLEGFLIIMLRPFWKGTGSVNESSASSWNNEMTWLIIELNFESDGLAWWAICNCRVLCCKYFFRNSLTQRFLPF